ncbi:hypothetical protein ACMC56_05645 [Campylobacterota bacterium DY0563]
MFSEDEKYQNLLAQLHELNRQNLLNENEKNEELMQKIDYLNSIVANKNEDKTNNTLLYKILYVLIGLTIFNTLLCIFIIFNLNPKKDNQEETIIQASQQTDNINTNEEVIEKPIKEIPIENAVTFDQVIEEEEKIEEYEEMKPIIKKDTIYSCEDDNYTKIYKIPYTVEIKGKLYQDRFVFILQNDMGTRKCVINKNDI